MAALLINSKDAYSEWGVRMGDGFIDALFQPPTLKDYITNDSALEAGTQYCSYVPKQASRKLTLVFTLEGDTQAEYLANRVAFYNVLEAGDLTVQVPDVADDVFTLKYTGTSVSFAQNTARTFCKLSLSFAEPDPTNR